MSDDLEFYNSNESKLHDALRKGAVLAPPSCVGRVGIVNQGATCYLNSLIQCLYYDESFKSAVLRAKSESPILRALQKLFLSLMLSHSSAISSEDLIAAFGWTKSQVFEQQDVHELFSLLLDSLSQISPELNEHIQTIFQGGMTDSLVCPSCGHQRDCPAAFMNISLELPATGANPAEVENPEAPNDGTNKVRLTELLQEHMKPEVLDEDNKWECGGCNTKVQATKKLEYKKIPSSLIIHLKRIRFDQGATRKRKLTTPVIFHEYLDVSPLTGEKDENSYRLQSVLLHTGTANGGHYRAYVRDAHTNTWLDCNDAVVYELKDTEVATLFWRDNAGSRPMSASGDKAAVAFKLDTIYENAYMLRYEKVTDIDNKLVVSSPTSIAALMDEGRRLNDISEMGVSADLISEVQSANNGLVELQRLYKIHQIILKFKVYIKKTDEAAIAAENQTPVIVSALQSDSYNALLIRVYNSLVEAGHLAAPIPEAGIDAEGKISQSFLAVCRIRVFSESRNQAGETFGGRETLPLSGLGFTTGVGFARSMLFETRAETDAAPFVEFNPKEMQLKAVVWSEALNEAITRKEDMAAACAAATVLSVLAPGEDAATVNGLRTEVAKLLEKPVESIILIISNDRCTVELTVEDDSKTLRKGFGIWPGDFVYVEVKPAETSDSSSGFVSQALAALKGSQQSIQIHFNDPRLETSSSSSSSSSSSAAAAAAAHQAADIAANTDTDAAAGGGVDSALYKFTVTVSTASTLVDVKQLMAGILGISDTESFYLRRSAASSAPQLKDASKTMHDLGISNQSILYLQLGKGCQPGEHVLRFDLDVSSDSPTSTSATTGGEAEAENDAEATATTTATAGVVVAGKEKKDNADIVSLGDVIVKERLSVLQLKEQLLQSWSQLIAQAGSTTTSLPTPQSVDHIRLRDSKGSGTGGPLRNDRILSRCLLGLVDGRRIVVQILPAPEIIGPDDLVLSLRLATYSSGVASAANPYGAKRLYRSMDFPMTRSSTVQDLYTAVLKKFPHLSFEEPPAAAENNTGSIAEAKFVSVAKGFTSGPQLTLKASLKLKWNDPAILAAPEAALDRPPLNLRDGSIIVVRGVADFEKAREAAKVRKAAEDTVSEGGAPAAAGAVRTAGTVSGSAFAAARERARTAGRGRRPANEDVVVIKEKGIKINVPGALPVPNTATVEQTGISIAAAAGEGEVEVVKEVPRPPQFSLEDSADSLPSVPVKLVKALREEGN